MMRSQKTINKCVLTLLAATFIVLALTLPAASKGNKVVDIDERIPIELFGVDNPCTIEFDDIYLAGEQHIKTQIVVDENGITKITDHYNTRLSGVDVNGLEYKSNEVYNLKAEYAFEALVPAPLTAIYKTKLVSKGNTDNFYIKSTFHINSKGEITKAESVTECQD